jgi:hypothetical protein
MAVGRVIEEVDAWASTMARRPSLAPEVSLIALPISLVRSAVGFRRERC